MLTFFKGTFGGEIENDTKHSVSTLCQKVRISERHSIVTTKLRRSPLFSSAHVCLD